MKKILLLSFMFFCLLSFSQKNQFTNSGLVPENLEAMNKTSNKTSTLNTSFKSIEGTYQIQISDIDYKVLLSKSLYDLIIGNRKNNEPVFIELDDKSILYLPSLNAINNSSFKKLQKTLYKTKQ